MGGSRPVCWVCGGRVEPTAAKRVRGRPCCDGCFERAVDKARIVAAGDQIAARVRERVERGWCRSVQSVEEAVARQLAQLRAAVKDSAHTGEHGWVAGEAEQLAALCALWAALLRAHN